MRNKLLIILTALSALVAGCATLQNAPLPTLAPQATLTVATPTIAAAAATATPEEAESALPETGETPGAADAGTAAEAESLPTTEPATEAQQPTATPEPTATPGPPSPTRYTYRVIAEYPHDAAAWTQGLDFDEGQLYEGTGDWENSSLRLVDLTSGQVVRKQALPDPQYYGEGITILDGKIYQITWQQGTAFVYERDTFAQLDTFNYPTEGWGLTHDGQQLIMSDGTSTIYFRDPETFEELRRITVRADVGPINMINELEYIDGEIWGHIWLTDLIIRIDPATGYVTGLVDLSGLLDRSDPNLRADVLNGIALDETTGKLYVTGKYWPSLFEIEVIPAE